MALKVDELIYNFPLLSTSINYYSWSILAKAILIKKNLL